jgi:hypothetical protein
MVGIDNEEQITTFILNIKYLTISIEDTDREVSE